MLFKSSNFRSRISSNSQTQQRSYVTSSKKNTAITTYSALHNQLSHFSKSKTQIYFNLKGNYSAKTRLKQLHDNRDNLKRCLRDFQFQTGINYISLTGLEIIVKKDESHPIQDLKALLLLEYSQYAYKLSRALSLDDVKINYTCESSAKEIANNDKCKEFHDPVNPDALSELIENGDIHAINTLLTKGFPYPPLLAANLCSAILDQNYIMVTLLASKIDHNIPSFVHQNKTPRQIADEVGNNLIKWALNEEARKSHEPSHSK